MNLKKALDSFYYSTALCNLRLMNEKFVDEHITYNSLLYLYRYQDNEAVRRITEKYSGEEIRMFCDMLDMISEINFEELKGE